jgi:predicted RNase H-like nuclease (RuvC/YqgF family)
VSSITDTNKKEQSQMTQNTVNKVSIEQCEKVLTRLMSENDTMRIEISQNNKAIKTLRNTIDLLQQDQIPLPFDESD